MSLSAHSITITCLGGVHQDCENVGCSCICHKPVPLPANQWLTNKQRAVAALVAEGYPTHDIARELKMGLPTVKNTLSRIYRRLEFPRNREQKLRLALYWHCELFQIGLRAA